LKEKNNSYKLLSNRFTYQKKSRTFPEIYAKELATSAKEGDRLVLNNKVPSAKINQKSNNM